MSFVHSHMPSALCCVLELAINCYFGQAWNLLGLCQVSMGDIRPGAAAYERVLKMDPQNLEAWCHLGQARKEVSSAPLRF